MDGSNPWGSVDPNLLISTIGSPTAGIDAYQAAQAAGAQRQLAAAQNQRAIQQQAIGDAALKDALSNPNPDTYRALLIARPDLVAGAKAAHDSLDEDTQRSQLRDLSAVNGYLTAGQPDDAAQILQNYIGAAKKGGQDTKSYESLLNTIQTNPRAAQVLTGTLLAATGGADKAVDAQGKLAMQPLDQQAKRADIAKTQAETNRINNPLPETASAGIGPDGKPVFFNPKAPPPAPSATLSANNGALDGFVQQIIQSESGGKATATNGASTATGAAQFLNKTWRPLIQQLHPELTQGKSDQQILDLRNNPQLAAEATAAFAQQNAQTLGAAGLPVNGATLAMAHKLGAGGAQAVLGADPNASLSQVLPREVLAANPSLVKQTAGQYASNLAKAFGTTTIEATPGDPNATGNDFLKTLPPARARMIQAIANGDMAMPPSVGRNAAQSQLLAQQVLQYDPSASAINLPARQQTRKAFTSGTQGQSIVQANTVGGHLAALDALADTLGNTGIPLVNGVKNTVLPALGNQSAQKSQTNFKTLSNTLASELTKFYRNNGGSEKDVEEFRKQLDPNGSPTQIHAAIQQMAGAVLSKIGALNDSYNAGMGKTADGLNLPNVNHNAIVQLQRLAGEGGSQGGASAPQVAVNPQTGARVVYDPGSRSWKPA